MHVTEHPLPIKSRSKPKGRGLMASTFWELGSNRQMCDSRVRPLDLITAIAPKSYSRIDSLIRGLFPGSLHLGCFGPPSEIVGKAGEGAFELLPGAAQRFAFRS